MGLRRTPDTLPKLVQSQHTPLELATLRNFSTLKPPQETPDLAPNFQSSCCRSSYIESTQREGIKFLALVEAILANHLQNFTAPIKEGFVTSEDVIILYQVTSSIYSAPMVDYSESNEREIVLIALLGLSPATLTETIWALAEQEEPQLPDRVIVITTTTGKKRLQEVLFTGDTWEQFKRTLVNAFGLNIECKLRFGNIPECIRVIPDASLSSELDDIRSPKDNRAVADFLMENLRGLTENNSTVLITSIAGGRKTMGALLLSVMTLIGRIEDRVTHVLVDEPWDRVPGFLYPGCTGDFLDPESGKILCSDKAKLSLAEVPFIPLRYLFEKELRRSAGSYLRLVDELRSRTLNMVTQVEIFLIPATASLQINNAHISLSPMEYAFYWYFSRRAANEMGVLQSYKDIPERDIVDLLNSIPQNPATANDLWTSKPLSSLKNGTMHEDWRRIANTIKQKLKKANFDPVQIDLLIPKRGRLSISVPPENISIEL